MEWLLLLLPLLSWVPAAEETSTAPDHEGVRDYCERDVFQPTCPPDHVVLMVRAQYGRMREGDCIPGSYGSIGCSADVMRLYDRECSGRPSCERVVATSVTDEESPCPRDLRSYLQAEYTCVPVMTATKQECSIYHRVTVTQASGYLSSHVTQETGIGSLECPWVLRAQPGQRVRIVLLDFFGASQTVVCHVYAIVKDQESATSRTETVCAGPERMREVFVSTSHKVEVRLVVKRQQELGYFMLRYEAVGCGDLAPPAHGYFKRLSETRAELGCRGGDGRRWSLRCEGDTWRGTRGNCSGGAGAAAADGSGSGSNIPSGLSIFVIICIAIGVGLVILITGLVCIKRSLCLRDNARVYKPEEEAASGVYQAYQGHRLAHVTPGRAGAKPGEPRDYGYNPQTENDYFRTWQLRHGGAGIQPGVHGFTGHIPPPPPPPGYPSNSSDYNSRYVEHVYESPKFERKNPDSGQNGDEATHSTKYYELESQLGSSSTHTGNAAGHAPPGVTRQSSWASGYKDPSTGGGNLSY